MEFTKSLETALRHFSTTGGFLTAKHGDTVNTMTISWGFIGFMWGKPYFITVVRPQRYTRPILDQSGDFTVSIPYGTMQQELAVCGTKSGADIDKSKVVRFVDAQKVGSPVVDGCNMYYECRVDYTDQLDEKNLPENIRQLFYNDDYHYVYMGEIVECYEKRG